MSVDKPKFKPINKKILVKVNQVTEEKTDSGIILSTGSDEKLFVGVVVRENDNPLIREGSEVIFSKNSSTDIILDQPYKIVNERSVFLYTKD